MCLPCWHLSPSRLFSVFSSMFVGDGKWFFLPHIHPCPEVPPSPLPLQEVKEGEGMGGQGSPSVLRLHRVFRLNQENFYYQKEKKKKKTPSGHLSSLPHWDSQDWICGVPGRVAQGWNTLRQEWWSSLAGPPPGPLWASPLSPLLSPPSDPPEVALPAPRPLGYRPLHWGRVGVLHSLGEGGQWDAGSLHTMASAYLPQSWAFPSMSCCGDICSPPQKSVPSSPTFLAEGGPDPSTGRGVGVGSWALSPQGAARERGHRLLRSGRVFLKAAPLTTTTPLLSLPWH